MVENKRLGPVFLLAVLALVGVSAAQASSACVDGSLSAYAPATAVSAPIACQFQDLIFTFAYNELIYQADPSQAPLGFGDRIENHVNIAFFSPSPGVEGIMLSPTADYPWMALNGNSADVNLSYTVSVATPGLSVLRAGFDVSATITGPAGGAILGAETLCCPMGSSTSPQSLQLTVNQFATGTGTDAVWFDVPQTSLTANKDLLIATIGDQDQVLLNSFSQTFTLANVPEPGVWLLTAGGLGLMLCRKRKWFGKALGALAICCLAVSAAHASPLCTDTTTIGGNTLDKYIANGTCEINGSLFTFGAGSYNYNFSGGVGIGNPIAASAVTVVVQNGASEGFQFVGQWAASGAQTGDLTMQFTVSAPSGMAVDDAFFSTTTSKSGAGTVGGTASVTNGVPPGGYNFPPGSTLVPIPVTPNLSTVTMTAVVNLKGNGNSNLPSRLTDNAHLSNLVMTVTEGNGTPEPLSAAFLGGGLVVLSLLARKRV